MRAASNRDPPKDWKVNCCKRSGAQSKWIPVGRQSTRLAASSRLVRFPSFVRLDFSLFMTARKRSLPYALKQPAQKVAPGLQCPSTPVRTRCNAAGDHLGSRPVRPCTQSDPEPVEKVAWQGMVGHTVTLGDGQPECIPDNRPAVGSSANRRFTGRRKFVRKCSSTTVTRIRS